MDGERYTFSSLLNKLIEVQSKIIYFYGTTNILDVNVRNIFSLYSKEYNDIVDKLEKVKREKVTEFTLEPIYGLNLVESIKKIDVITNSKSINYNYKAKMIEEEMLSLFNDVMQKTAHMSAELNQVISLASELSKKRISILNAC